MSDWGAKKDNITIWLSQAYAVEIEKTLLFI